MFTKIVELFVVSYKCVLLLRPSVGYCIHILLLSIVALMKAVFVNNRVPVFVIDNLHNVLLIGIGTLQDS